MHDLNTIFTINVFGFHIIYLRIFMYVNMSIHQSFTHHHQPQQQRPRLHQMLPRCRPQPLPQQPQPQPPPLQLTLRPPHLRPVPSGRRQRRPHLPLHSPNRRRR